MKVTRTCWNAAARCVVAVLGIGFGLCIPTNIALADNGNNLEQLTGEWWQWAFSIPTAQNPVVDQNGGNCMIGQHGAFWFLAGNFGGTTTRTCTVPAGTPMFFPVINQVGYNSPNCGQGPENLSAKTLRKAVGDIIDTARALSVELDSHPIHFQRVQSDVFAITLPAGNIAGCAPGVYSPAVDDGYYAKLDNLSVGSHSLRIRATVQFPPTEPPFQLDVTYNLVVVKVSAN
jgi:hypothetical protein